MSVGIAFGVFLVVHVLVGYLLRASGVWSDMFGRLRDVPYLADDPELAERPGEWIDNHEFWALSADSVAGDEAEVEADAAIDEDAFWRAS